MDPQQFTSPWWYRTEYTVDFLTSQTVTLLFKGINYKANMWLNGQQVAVTESTVGTFRYFTFVITDLITSGSPFAVALEIFQPIDNCFPPNNNDTDLALTFVDWNPPPPDASMGLWREVILSVTSGILIDSPLVNTEALAADYSAATLQVAVRVTNFNSVSVVALVQVELGQLASLSQSVVLEANTSETVFFNSSEFPQLIVEAPTLWWPWQMGEPYLYILNASVAVNDFPSGSLSAYFGIRQVTSELTSLGYRQYKVNGLPILIRGAGWTPDMLLRWDAVEQQQQFEYVRGMNLNAVRLEGKLPEDGFFDLADQMGILLLPGWCCCDAWQHWPSWGPLQYAIAAQSLTDQVRRLRIHPSILVFLYSSDELPPVDVEQLYLSVFETELWPNPVLSTASNLTSPITGPSGVKMSGPYSWVPPNYWLDDYPGHLATEFGGAYSFLTEGGPGENPLTLEALERTIPTADIWPISSYWDWHCGNPEGLFYNLRYFTPPLNARYGTAKSAADYLMKAQVATYEAHRSMFEAYSRNKYTSTGLIQWMLNNAWPEMIWHLFDQYMTPSSTYFATQKACEPVHPMYSYNDASIWLINSQYLPVQDLTVSATIMNLSSAIVYSKSVAVPVLEADAPLYLFQLPNNLQLSTTYFLLLTVSDAQKNTLTDNFYWLSTKADVLDWSNSTFFRTACSSYADFTALQTLPPVDVQAKITQQASGQVSVSVINAGDNLAFFVRIRLLNASQVDILPVLWSDNYFTLLSQATRSLTATLPGGQVATSVVVEVFNDVSGADPA